MNFSVSFDFLRRRVSPWLSPPSGSVILAFPQWHFLDLGWISYCFWTFHEEISDSLMKWKVHYTWEKLELIIFTSLLHYFSILIFFHVFHGHYVSFSFFLFILLKKNLWLTCRAVARRCCCRKRSWRWCHHPLCRQIACREELCIVLESQKKKKSCFSLTLLDFEIPLFGKFVFSSRSHF